MRTYFVNVLLPLALPNKFTYRAKQNQNELLQIGKRVVVPFGKNKLYTGIICEISEIGPTAYEAKYIEAIIDDLPIVNTIQLSFWQWMSNYYMCTEGEVMSAALPGGLKLESETKLLMHPFFVPDSMELNNQEFLIVEALLKANALDLKEVAAILNVKHVYQIVKKMIDRKIIIAVENLKNKYSPKIAEYIQLHPDYENEASLHQLMNDLEKAPSQLRLLLHFLKLSRHFSKERIEVKRNYLLKTLDVSSSVLKSMLNKGIFLAHEIEESRLMAKKLSTKIFELNEYQQDKLNEIKGAYEEFNTVLLHGVTSSGKTEIYIKLIEEQLSNSKQVLYLLPEIALTTQLIGRLQKAFGDMVGVYHSKFNENERVEVWYELLKGKQSKFKIIIGARSALFLPYQNLGLVVVDEEHETTFKQLDPAPRYNARDSAIVLANFHGAKVILGSATPSLESIYNVSEKKFAYVRMKKRFGGIMLPEMECVDLKKARKRREMQSIYSTHLIDEIRRQLHAEKQVILFQNRRGFSKFIQCYNCANTPECKYCDISLTYHKFSNKLICHYCGYQEPMHTNCKKCGSAHIGLMGFGTEKAAEELEIIFPDAKIKRLDLDTTRSKNAYQKIIEDFENKDIDILIGTQMVSKGLDFDHVGLVGILDADGLIHYPEFRAHERAYQLMEQVAGRAGRRKDRGKVIIQAINHEHSIVQQVLSGKYEEMVKNELFERKRFHYPPYYKMIKLTLKSKDNQLLNKGADLLADALKDGLGGRVIGPEVPLVGRINNYYLKNIIIKAERKITMKKLKGFIQVKVDELYAQIRSNKIRVNINVDP